MLELSNIDAGYGSFQALFGISMSVKAGEAVAVIGSNGAGKTTLLRVISGLLPASSGAMTMEGVSLRATPPHKIIETGIAHVPEGRRLFPRLSVENNLRIGAYIPAAREKFAERLAFVYDLFPRLKERRTQLAGTLSGGEQQMCAIARALMSGPKLVLLDEPSMGLAPVIVAQVFELVRKLRGEGYTVLIVEQNVRQVLKIVDRAYLLEVGRIKASGRVAGARRERRDPQGVYGDLMDCQLDIFFLEAILNGLLLAGLLALLALGLNLIFGVIDVVWICYAELMMIGMYGINFAYKGGAPFLAAAVFGILLIALAGALMHYLVIRPVLDSAPINQLLVTGGVLFVLQAAATMAFGIDFKNIGIRLGSITAFDMSFSYSRIVTFGVAICAMLVLWIFLQRSYIGIAIRAIAQDRQIMPLMGVDQRKVYLVTSAIGGGLVGLAAALMVLQFDIYPQIGLQFGPLIFMICVLGGLGNMIGGFIAAVIISQFIAIGSSCFATEWGYAIAFLFFMVVIFIKPQGLFGGKS